MDHSFVIPVYGAAPHLAELIESLLAQTGLCSQILLSSSTPSTELAATSKRFGLPLYINPQRIDIAADWNFALEKAETQFVTLAHQDDIFAPGYVMQMGWALRRNPDAVLGFCDYSEHTPHGERPVNINLRIKRVLRRHAFGVREYIVESRDKMRLLSLGNPICCPSVMLNRRLIDDFRFPGGFKTNLDWMAWLELARQPGGFVYLRECLVSKGVHADSETTATIANRVREREDRAIFDSLWPRPIAVVLARLYKIGYRANRS
jgi:glycosyltransferase involved in cell wall biosynthesis